MKEPEAIQVTRVRSKTMGNLFFLKSNRLAHFRSWLGHNYSTSRDFVQFASRYDKAACALHQIRYMLGDTLFFQMMQAYCADTNLKFKSATIADFNAKVNEISGANYDWYFTDWIFQPNHPVYQNKYNFEDLGTGQWHVNFQGFTGTDKPGFLPDDTEFPGGLCRSYGYDFPGNE